MMESHQKAHSRKNKNSSVTKFDNGVSSTGATIELVSNLKTQDKHCSPSEGCGPQNNPNPCYPTNYCNPNEKK